MTVYGHPLTTALGPVESARGTQTKTPDIFIYAVVQSKREYVSNKMQGERGVHERNIFMCMTLELPTTVKVS
jgi:hypothetical protein